MTSLFEPIKAKKATEGIIEQFLDTVRIGKLRPGEKLPAERELANFFGVSRACLREAMQTLECNGILRKVQGSGSYLENITEVSMGDPLRQVIKGNNSAIADLAEFRGAIETWAAGMAALRARKEHIDELKNIVKSMRKGIDQKKPIHKLDADFHYTIAKAAQNMVYLHVGHTIYFLYSEMSRLYFERVLYSSKSEVERIYREHVKIFDAIENKDSEKAQDLMKNHLLKPERWFRENQNIV